MEEIRNVYIAVAIFGGINVMLCITFGAFLPVFFGNIDELSSQHMDAKNYGMAHSILLVTLAPVFGIVAVCSFIGLLIWMILNSFRREPEESWR